MLVGAAADFGIGALDADLPMTNPTLCTLLTPESVADARRLIVLLGRRYVQYANKTHRRTGTGTAWDSHYKSALITPYAPA